jgi:hypothetical protein
MNADVYQKNLSEKKRLQGKTVFGYPSSDEIWG